MKNKGKMRILALVLCVGHSLGVSGLPAHTLWQGAMPPCGGGRKRASDLGMKNARVRTYQILRP